MKEEEDEGDGGEEGEEEEAVLGSGEWERRETLCQEGHGRCFFPVSVLFPPKSCLKEEEEE